MKNDVKAKPEVNVLPMAKAFRSLAAGLRSGKSVDEIFDAVGRALSAVPGMESAVLHSGSEAVEVSSNALTAPILDENGVVGAHPGGDEGALRERARGIDGKGDLAEIKFYEKALSSEEENRAGYRLAEKWGISTHYVPPGTMVFFR